MKKPTDEQIKQEIEKLKELKTKVRSRTAFGESNTDAIQAQIDVLEKGWTNETIIWDHFPEIEEDAHARDAAMEALAWKNGKDNAVGEYESPSQSWRGLVKE